MAQHLPLTELPPFITGQMGWVWSGNVDMSPAKMKDGRPYPSISIVTPSYNQSKFLEETIRSVISQGYPNLEYIIMDGGSTDGSVEIIKKYDSWLSQWHTAPDRGQYDAVQKGFQLSRGEIMAYLNSDDLYFPWTLKVVAELFTLFPGMQWLTASNIAVASEDSRFSFVGYIHNRSRRWFFSNRGEKLKSSGFIPQEGTFWRRALWEKAGSKLNIDLKYAGDFELWSRFFKYASPVMVNMPLGIFRHHGKQKTKQFEKYVEEANRILADYPDPARLPPILVDAMNYVHQRVNYDGDWLGTRCDKINFRPLEGYWMYEKCLEPQDG